MKAGWRSAAALLGVLALAGLAACRADASVAAYVDGAKITEAEVDEVLDGVRGPFQAGVDQQLSELETQLDQRVSSDAEFTEDDAAQEFADAEAQFGEQFVELRDRVVEMRVLTEVATGYAADEGLDVGEPPVPEVAGQLGLPADSGYVQVQAEFFAVMGALQGSLDPVAPTEADQREVYEQLVGLGMQDVPFERVQPELTQELMGGQVAVRNAVAAAVDQAKITLNPRYNLVFEVPIQLGNAEVSLGVPLGDSAVVEAG